MEAFEPIYENGEINHFICNTCHNKVERGILNIGEHYFICPGHNHSMIPKDANQYIKDIFYGTNSNVQKGAAGHTA